MVHSISVAGMTCGGCAVNVEQAILTVPGVSNVAVDYLSGRAEFSCNEADVESIKNAVQAIGFTVGKENADSAFDWSDKSIWKQSANNTKWCLIGCSIGDFGTIAAFQFVFTDSGWSPMMIMALAMFNGILTSIILETIILLNQMGLVKAFKTAIGMSLISMISIFDAR